MNQLRQSDYERAVARIKELICAGSIKPGQQISERSLALELGLGRTPVRQALKDFARDGLLEILPMRGTFLRRPTLDDVREIYEVRLAVEGMAAFLVAQRGAPNELRKYRKKFNDFLTRDDPKRLAAMDRVGWQFHEAIIAATGNARMMKTYKMLRLPIVALRFGHPVGAEQSLKSLREHLSILDAIESGDGALAQSRIMKHLAGVLEARTRLTQAPIYDESTAFSAGMMDMKA